MKYQCDDVSMWGRRGERERGWGGAVSVLFLLFDFFGSCGSVSSFRAFSMIFTGTCGLLASLTTPLATPAHLPPPPSPQALFESQWAEADLPVPGESRSAALRRRAALRSVRYRLAWRTQLRGPLREAARQAVRAASAAALAAGGAGAMSVAREFSEDILPQLAGDGEPSDDEWTLGLFAERACLALGLRAHQPPPPSRDGGNASSSSSTSSSSSSSGNGGVDEAIAAVIGLGSIGSSLSLNNSGSEKAGRDACADWLFGPRQGAWLSAETAAAAAAAAAGTPAAPVVQAAWLALDAVLSPATVLLAFHASRGTEYSSVWARPDKLVWAKQAKNFYWPAMLLWGSGTSTALKEVNIGRVPPAFRDELEKQVGLLCVFL